MAVYFIDTGFDNQLQIEAESQAEAIVKFIEQGRWTGCLEKQTKRPYVDWSKVSFYVSPPQEVCIADDCDEIVTDGADTCLYHEECPYCGETECNDPHEED